MCTPDDERRIHSFAYVVGGLECSSAEIGGFYERWHAIAADVDFATMGCDRVRKLSAPIDHYIIESVRQTLGRHGVSPGDVDHVVFATTDATLGSLGADFVVRVLDPLGLVKCIPTLIAFHQCSSSLPALAYAWDRFSDADVDHVLVVSFTFSADDLDRVQPFALLSDGVASCLVSRSAGAGLRLAGTAVEVGHEGIMGRDTIASRREVSRATLAKAFRDTDITAADVARVFPTNLYKPLTVFNAVMAGVDKHKLHFEATLGAYGHCGPCDWMINLADYEASTGIEPGSSYLAQSSAPGFSAFAVLHEPATPRQ